jgi:hypothetical protein
MLSRQNAGFSKQPPGISKQTLPDIGREDNIPECG